MSETPPEPNDMHTGIVAYRLGRVEKAVDAINFASGERDAKIYAKLDDISKISGEIAVITTRLKSLESWRSNLNKYIVGLSVAVVTIIGNIFISFHK